MKVKELIELLQATEENNDVFLEDNGKFSIVELAKSGPFLSSFTLSAKVDMDVRSAEETLLNILQYNPEGFKGIIASRITRALGESRVGQLQTFIADKLKKQQEEEEEMEKAREEVNRMEVRDISTDEAMTILEDFYSGTSKEHIDTVKAAKELVGSSVAESIFKKARDKK